MSTLARYWRALLGAVALVLSFLALRRLKAKPTTVPASRPVPVGTPDDRGITQVNVGTLEEPGLFETKDHVTLGDIEVPTPVGVKPSEVEAATVIQPHLEATSATNKSKVSAEKVTDLVERYRGLR